MRILASLGCVVAFLALGACHRSGKDGEAAPLRGINVVLVTIDTLRPDRLGCYGYTKVATPNLDKLAQSGTLFENAVTHTPLTAPSHASIFTGTYPTVHKVRDTGGFVLQGPHATLAEILQRHGWATAAFVGASVLKKGFGFNRGFTVYDDQMPKLEPGRPAGDYAERRAGEVVKRAVEWLQRQEGQPFFLWVHVFDPHSPYDPPAPFREQYRGRAYEGEVAYTDTELGRLFDAVAEKTGGENTLVVVLSDHGESLSEHGEYSHGVFLYDVTLRIACVMSGPGIPKGRRVKQQARAIDVLPTILELIGGKPPAGVEGGSLVRAMAGKMDPGAWSYAESLYPKINMGWAELRGVRTNRWKYIRAPKPELYDLSRDPAETTNVISLHPEESRELEARLRSVAAEGEKVETTMVDRRTMEQLKSLGYLGGSSRSEYTLKGEGTDPKDRTGVLKLLYLAISPDAGENVTQRIPTLRRALAEDPHNPTIYYHLGDEYDKAGRSAEAIKLYSEGIRNGVRNAWLYSRLGNLYIRQGNHTEAIAAFERAAQRNPSDCESLSDLGMAYLDTGRPGDAERVYKWCLATGEEYAPAYNGLGLVAVKRQDMTAARGYFEKAVQYDPDLLEAQLNLGRIYKMIGANKRARTCFEAFLAKATPAEYGRIIPKIKAELAELQ
jgi:choline-sulfatase